MMSERDITQGCKQGNPIAQRELFDRYSPFLMAVIYRYIGDDDDAKDVLQETFLTIFSTFKFFKWKGEGSLKAWLTRVAVTRSLNFLRDKKRLKTTSFNSAGISKPPDDIDEETTYGINRLDIDTILKLIAELPDGYRTVFNLYCLDGFSHQEIAEQLGISEKTSSSQLARAKALLATKIKEYVKKQNE